MEVGIIRRLLGGSARPRIPIVCDRNEKAGCKNKDYRGYSPLASAWAGVFPELAPSRVESLACSQFLKPLSTSKKFGQDDVANRCRVPEISYVLVTPLFWPGRTRQAALRALLG